MLQDRLADLDSSPEEPGALAHWLSLLEQDALCLEA